MTDVAESRTPADTPRRRRRNRPLLLVAGAVAVLVLGEVFAGWMAPRLHDAPMFHSTEADLKVRQMDALGADGGVDVVFMGSSVTGVAVDPTIVAGDGTATVYNASLASAGPSLLYVWARDVVLPSLEPSVVVVGVTSYALDDSEGEGFRDLFVDSPGYRRYLGTESVMERADRFLYEHSNIWKHRGDLRNPKTFLAGLADTVVKNDWAAITTAEGHMTPVETDVDFVDAYGPDLDEWSIRPEAEESLRSLIDVIETSGATVVLVGMPVSDHYLSRHPDGEDDVVRYESELRRIADDADVSLLYYDDRDIEHYADRVHMNASGSAAFSAQLSSDLQRLGVLTGDVEAVDGFGTPLPPSPPLTFGE